MNHATRTLAVSAVLAFSCVPKDGGPPAPCDGGTTVIGVGPDAGEPAEVPEPGAAPEGGPLETVMEPAGPARLPHSPYFDAASVRIPLKDVPLDVVNRGLEHVLTTASNPAIGADWADAELLLTAIPLYRPDVAARPIAYEFKLEKGGASAGWLVVGADLGDAPIVSFNTKGASPVERTYELAAASGRSIAKVYQLDGSAVVAEDAAGSAVAADPLRWYAITRDAAGGPPRLSLGTEADWAQVKASFGPATSDWRANQTTGFAGAWVKEDMALTSRMNKYATTDNLISLNQVSAIGVRSFITVEQGLNYKAVCENTWAASPYPVGLDDLTPLWNQINSGFEHPATGSTATCASGCTPLAIGIVMGWLDRVATYGKNPDWTRPDARRAFFRYTSAVDPHTLTQPLGESAYEYRPQPPWAWVGESKTDAQAMDMRRYLTELSSAVHTSCDGTQGNTKWPDINGLQGWIDAHKIPVLMHTGSNPFGESGFRDDIVKQLRSYGAPGIMHYGGWSGHTIVVNAHQQCDLYEKDGSGNFSLASSGQNFFYTNFGRGSKAANRWLAIGNLMMSTTFRPMSSGLMQFEHSGELMTPASSQLGAAAVQQPVSQNPFDLLKSFMTFEAVGDGSVYITNNAGYCLNTGLSTALGTPAAFYPCANGQYQRFTPWMFSDNRWVFYEAFSNKCLGVEDGSGADGARVVLKKCAGASDASQTFTFY